ncbi:MAG: small multi-drug export protein [Candidatus Kuenenbacteria bacterium]
MIFSFLNNLPGELAILVIAMLPIAEVRVSIPVGLEIYGMPIWPVLFWSLIGNIGAGYLLIILISPISQFLSRKFKFFDKIFKWIFDRTRKKFYDKYQHFGDIALLLFVAIPLPTTGVWTGAIASWLFGIEKKKSCVLIATGALIASLIVSLISLGFFKFIF